MPGTIDLNVVDATVLLAGVCDGEQHHVGIAVDEQRRLQIITIHDDEEALAAIAGHRRPNRTCLALASLWRGLIGDHDPHEVARHLRRSRSTGRAVLNRYVTGEPGWAMDVTAWRLCGVDRMDHLQELVPEGHRRATADRGPTARPNRAEVDALLIEYGYEPPARMPR